MSLYRLMKKMERNQRRQQTSPPPNIVAPWKEYTIAAGVITLTGYDKIRGVVVDTESDDATDDLVTISGGQPGDIIICCSANADRDPTFKDGTGNLQLSGDFTCTAVTDTIMLIMGAAGVNWLEVSRSDNG